jgi:hypothetical protein
LRSGSAGLLLEVERKKKMRERGEKKKRERGEKKKREEKKK